jgi:predicted nucleic acid-binding protein
MPGSSPLYYWDACLFLTWLKDKERNLGEMDGVRELIARCRRGEVKIMTSVLTSVEVLAARIPVGMDTHFAGLMKRISRANVDTKVASLAHDLRNHYARKGGKNLSAPDAIHLATAVHYRADQLHTFDEVGSRRSLGLIPLSGDVGGHKLRICKPVARHPQLDLRKPTSLGDANN